MSPGAHPALPGTRRRLLAALAALGAAGMAAGASAWAAGRQLPLASALAHEIDAALARGQPLVVMVSLHGCPFCEVVRNNYLAPMREREGLPVVQVNMHDAQALRDAQGHESSHDAQVRAWGVSVAPTLLFLGQGGQELAPRLAGGDNDFYSALLDRRLETARAAISR
ncbi:hypothetical protein [Comamonas flocculans]|uniref:Thioredoxin fold domain-containing protein n=1 Tax=Comamonas flocculans TaxID=2597701 RepID=A0A5B8RQJ4_9BURK|nr:hypothetical protein [Comamonas flocculans]QEA11871.1 hypothetical protein FOZ74_01810 [Comamonas flocculans]